MHGTAGAALSMLGALLLGQAAAQSARAAVDGSEEAVLERIQALEDEVTLLKRQLEVKQEADDTKAKSAAVAGAGPDGFYLQSQDKKYQIKLRGYIQTDGRFYQEGQQPGTSNVDTFVMRRVRPIVEGTLGEHIDFKIMPDFGGNSPTLQDAYANLHYWNFAQLQAGKFKPPVGLERLQSATSLMFVERAFPTQLVPSRDIGFQLGGDVGNGLFTYQVGVFNGVRDNSSDQEIDTNDGKDIDARIFGHPFQSTSWEFLQGLGLGVSMTWGDQNQSTPLPSYRTTMQSQFFTYNPAAIKGQPAGVTVYGTRWRIAPQGYYYWGPFGLLAEYTASETSLQRGVSTLDATNKAWQVAASWVLTGENASFKGVLPRSPLTPDLSGFGALEVVARYTVMNLDDGIFPIFANPSTSARRASEWSVGLNWYLNRWIKLVLDYEQTGFKGGAVGGANRNTEGGVLTRLQVSY